MSEYKRKDHIYEKAKAAGVRSRAYFKLEELNKKQRLLKPGMKVIDLGAWPGGWSEFAAKAVGPKGRVVGIDLVQTQPLKAANTTFIQGDVADPDKVELLQQTLGGRADIIISDMSPKLSGIRECDDAAVAHCLKIAQDAARALLRPGGSLIVKTFPGQETEEQIRLYRQDFDQVKKVRLDATRSSSGELYVVARGHKGYKESETE